MYLHIYIYIYEKQLTQIIHRNVRAADNGKVKLNIYYENKKTQ